MNGKYSYQTHKSNLANQIKLMDQTDLIKNVKQIEMLEMN